MAKLVKKSPVPLYLAAAVWAVWAVFAPMYAWWHFVLAAVCSAAAWLLGKLQALRYTIQDWIYG